MEIKNFSMMSPKVKSRRRPQKYQNKSMAQLPLKESKGMLTNAPGSLPNKYTFEKDKSQSSSFCGCCPGVGQKKSQVYISPSELLSQSHFLKKS